MPKKWIRTREWQRQPHAKEPPASLWWYAYPDRQLVIKAYVAQCSRGRALPGKFKDELEIWLNQLSRSQNKAPWGHPRTYRYWTIPAYALANGLEQATLMKRLRELEKIARQEFPDRVPYSRKKRSPLAEIEIQEIKARYLSGVDAKDLADEFSITASQVGRICREEKAIRSKEREQPIAKQGAEAKDQSEFLPPPTPEDEL
jgi:hypothetical protein